MNEGVAATERGESEPIAISRLWPSWVGKCAVVVAVIVGGFMWRFTHAPAPTSKYGTVAVTRGDVVETISATGSVQALLQVSVGAQANGRVTKVAVDFNSVVKEGDLLAEIDQGIYAAQVAVETAQVAQQQAVVAQAGAQARTTGEQLETARIALQRTKRLFDTALASKADLDAARGAYAAAKATRNAALANIDVQRSAGGVQRAQLAQMKASLGYTKIYSPVDGVVISRNIDPGATVMASYQTPVLFVIARDLRTMRVLADIDETDVGKVNAGAPVDVVIDAAPGEVFHGTVQQVRYSPNNVLGVVTYSAVIDVENREEKLRPGMTAMVSIRTAEKKAALRVPSAALRYRPASASEPATAAPLTPGGLARVYVLADETLGAERAEEKLFRLGLDDGMYAEVLDGALAAGTRVILEDRKRQPLHW